MVMDEVLNDLDPFEVEIKTIGVFPKWKKPRVLWVGIGEGKITFLLSLLTHSLIKGTLK